MLIVNKKKYLIILSILIGIIFLVNDNFFNNDPNQIVFNNDIKKQEIISAFNLDSAMAIGVFDIYTKKDNTLRIAGWSVNNNKALPAYKIHVFYKDQYIGSAKANKERPGVTKISKNGNNLLKSGFDFSILSFPNDIDKCELDFSIEFNSNIMQELPNNKCKADAYLELNPVVKVAGVNPYQHYLEYGIKEGSKKS